MATGFWHQDSRRHLGSRSDEHDVSIVTGAGDAGAAPDRYEVVPIYITRDGRWLTGRGCAS